MKVKLVFFFVVFLLSLLIWFRFGSIETRDGGKESLAQVQLSSIRDDLDLWSLFEEDSDFKKKEKLAQSILRKVILIRSISPNVSKIKGEGLETLCLLNEHEFIFDFVENNNLVVFSKQYLSSIEDVVKQKISVLQMTMKGSGCFLSPNMKKEVQIDQ